MAVEYTIHYTNPLDPQKPSFVIDPNGFDITTTALTLPGRYVVNFGEKLATNFVRLLENFSSDVEPTITTSGMLWFDTSGGNNGEGIVKVRNTTNDGWIEVGATDASAGGGGGKFQLGGSSDFTAVVGGNYFVDTSSGPVTVLLPEDTLANPLFVGDIVGIVDMAGTFHTNNCIVDGNGRKVMGDPATLIMELRYSAIRFSYSGPVHGWRIVP